MAPLFAVSDRKVHLARMDTHVDKYSEVSRVPHFLSVCYITITCGGHLQPRMSPDRKVG